MSAERSSSATKPKHKRNKLPRLPQNAKVQKRPLLRPAIPSPHASASQQKVVYISTHTPFLSAVKRVEKLLHLADKRLVQSATANVQHQPRGAKRKRAGDGDEILSIAQEVESVKWEKRRKGNVGGVGDGGGAGEEVVLKGTGKAIHRVLELVLWFQQRDEEYVVRLRTGSVGAVDDITIEDGGDTAAGRGDGDEGVDASPGADEEATGDAMMVDADATRAADSANAPGAQQQAGVAGRGKKKRTRDEALTSDEVPETRIRYTSVLEAAVSLR